jgi:hypothetical protein
VVVDNCLVFLRGIGFRAHLDELIVEHVFSCCRLPASDRAHMALNIKSVHRSTVEPAILPYTKINYR